MAGEAKSNAFMLGAATVMIGAPADLFDLNPADHSIGLVKGFTLTSEPGYTDLTQGVKNTLAYSVMTSNSVRAQMEVYEYTSKNLTYALGLNGATVSAQTTVSTAAVAINALDTDVTVEAGDGSGFSVGDWIMIQEGTGDKVYTRKLTGVVTDTLSFDEALPKAMVAGSTVRLMNAIGVGSKDEQPFLAAKIVGTLANGDEMTVLIPKMRITNGFTLGFQTDNYGNLPFEFTVFDLVASDPNYSKFDNNQALLIANS